MASNALKPPGDDDLKPRAATGHMPFKGHRTVAGFWAQQAAARKHRKVMEWGFDPDSLKAPQQ